MGKRGSIYPTYEYSQHIVRHAYQNLVAMRTSYTIMENIFTLKCANDINEQLLKVLAFNNESYK